MTLGLPTHLIAPTMSRVIARAAHWFGLVCLAGALTAIVSLSLAHPHDGLWPTILAVVPMAILLVTLTRHHTVLATVGYLVVGSASTYIYAVTILSDQPLFPTTDLFVDRAARDGPRHGRRCRRERHDRPGLEHTGPRARRDRRAPGRHHHGRRVPHRPVRSGDLPAHRDRAHRHDDRQRPGEDGTAVHPPGVPSRRHHRRQARVGIAGHGAPARHRPQPPRRRRVGRARTHRPRPPIDDRARPRTHHRPGLAALPRRRHAARQPTGSPLRSPRRSRRRVPADSPSTSRAIAPSCRASTPSGPRRSHWRSPSASSMCCGTPG